MTTADPRVASYLERLELAAGALRPERRLELVAEIRGHIEVRLAAAPTGTSALSSSGDDAVSVTLRRLGEPEEIVAAAMDGTDQEVSPLPSRPGRRFSASVDAGALVLLLVGGFALGIGWVVGVVLLWLSARWTVGEKVLATLVWPLGLVLPVAVGGGMTFLVAEACTTTSTPDGSLTSCTGGSSPWVAVVFVLVLVAPLVVAGLLWRRSSRRARRVVEPVEMVELVD